MTDSKPAPVTRCPATRCPAEKRVLFLGVMLASFIVCFVVLGCITYVDMSNLRNHLSNLRNELREMKEKDRLTWPVSPVSCVDNSVDENDFDLDGEDEEAGISDWVPSFPVLGFKPSPAHSNTSEEKDEAHSRVRRKARTCTSCCRDCDCVNKTRRQTAKTQEKDCKRCCRACGRLCKGTNGQHVMTAIFKRHLGHFIGTNKNGSACGSRFLPNMPSSPFALATDTGDICSWDYATWMNNKSKKLYNLQDNGKVKVRDAGMYYVYGQIIIYDSKPTSSLSIVIRDHRGKEAGERELTKCVETAGYLIGEGGVIADRSGSFRTCNMGAVTELYAGSELYIVVPLPKTNKGTNISIKTFHNVTTAFFGIIKYT